VPLHDSCADPEHVREANGRSLLTLHKSSPSIAEHWLGDIELLMALLVTSSTWLHGRVVESVGEWSKRLQSHLSIESPSVEVVPIT
jgi:hypothetical protein